MKQITEFFTYQDEARLQEAFDVYDKMCDRRHEVQDVIIKRLRDADRRKNPAPISLAFTNKDNERRIGRRAKIDINKLSNDGFIEGKRGYDLKESKHGKD